MDQTLPLKFLAVSENSFTVQNNKEVIMTSKDYLSKNSWLNPKNVKSNDCRIEIYSIEKEKLLYLCDSFPVSGKVVQDYAVE